MKKAYRATVQEFEDLSMIHWAESAGKARYQNYRCAHEAGFYDVNFQDITIRRAPEYDDVPERYRLRGCGEEMTNYLATRLEAIIQAIKTEKFLQQHHARRTYWKHDSSRDVINVNYLESEGE